MVPTGPKSSVTHSLRPSGRLTLLTETLSRLKPPQPLNLDMSAVAWPLGVRPPPPHASPPAPCPRPPPPPMAGPLSDSRFVPPVWQPGGVGGGGSVTVSENAPVEVAPVASVTVTEKVCVPFGVGAPRSSPDDRSVRPAGGVPVHL